jgi:predicted DNA-binding transcriptional regulator AlpA
LTIEELLSRYVTRKSLATTLGIDERTLIRWEFSGSGPRATRIGRRVYYGVADVEAWLSSHPPPHPPQKKRGRR